MERCNEFSAPMEMRMCNIDKKVKSRVEHLNEIKGKKCTEDARMMNIWTTNYARHPR